MDRRPWLLPVYAQLKSSDILAHCRAYLPLLPPISLMSNSAPVVLAALEGLADGHSQGCCPVFSELRRGPGPLGKEYRERLPFLNLPLLSTASLGGGGGGKVRINVEESVDGKVVSSRKREI